MISIYQIFGVPLLQRKLSLEVINNLESIYLNFPSKSIQNLDQIYNLDDEKVLLIEIDKCLNFFSNSDPSFKLARYTNYWICDSKINPHVGNVMRKEGMYTGILWIKSSDNSPPFKIFSPNPFDYHYEALTPQSNLYFKDIPVEKGLLTIFPSYLSFSLPTFSELDNVCMVFNFTNSYEKKVTNE